MSNSAYALTLFVGWTLLLLIAMEAIRSYLVLSGQVASNTFAPDNEGLSPFMQRIARAHMNCVESLPVFGGILAIAVMTSRTAVTDPLALWFVLARVAQSSVHLISTSVLAVNIRFAAFFVQIVMGVYWLWSLLR